MSDTNPETNQPQSAFEPKQRPDPETGKTATEGQSISGEGQASQDEASDKTGAEGGGSGASKPSR